MFLRWRRSVCRAPVTLSANNLAILRSAATVVPDDYRDPPPLGWYSPSVYCCWRCAASRLLVKRKSGCQPGTAGMSLRELFIILLLVVLLVLLGFYRSRFWILAFCDEQHPAVVLLIPLLLQGRKSP